MASPLDLTFNKKRKSRDSSVEVSPELIQNNSSECEKSQNDSEIKKSSSFTYDEKQKIVDECNRLGISQVCSKY